MRYEGAVYRPPSEAYSLIIQLTIGCARNTCTFCSMYKDKKFRVRSLDEVVEDLELARRYYGKQGIRRVFLADGDALIVKTKDLLYILGKIKEIMPEVERVSAYGAPADVLLKTDEELAQLKAARPGYDLHRRRERGRRRLARCKKRRHLQPDYRSWAAAQKSRDDCFHHADFLASAGNRGCQEHAVNSAKVISAIKPE